MRIYPFEFVEFTDTKNNSLLKKFLSDKELPCIYGYTVDFNKRKVTSLLMVSSIPTCSLELEGKVKEKILEYINEDTLEMKYNSGGRYKKNYIRVRNLWKKRVILSCQLGVPLYVVLWNDDKVFLTEIKMEEENFFFGNTECMKWKNFAEKIRRLKSLGKQTKELMYVKISPFEKRLLIHGVSGPGDLDGFEILEDSKIVFYEFSTRNLSCERLEKHDPNYFMNQDFRRWIAPMILRDQVRNGYIDLVIWSPCCQEKMIIWKNINLEKDNRGNYMLYKQKVSYYYQGGDNEIEV